MQAFPLPRHSRLPWGRARHRKQPAQLPQTAPPETVSYDPSYDPPFVRHSWGIAQPTRADQDAAPDSCSPPGLVLPRCPPNWAQACRPLHYMAPDQRIARGITTKKQVSLTLLTKKGPPHEGENAPGEIRSAAVPLRLVPTPRKHNPHFILPSRPAAAPPDRTGDGGNNYKGQNEFTVHFGLGTTAMVDEVVVTWPGGHTRTLTNLVAKRTYKVHPAGDIPTFSAWGLVMMAMGIVVLATLVVRYRVVFPANASSAR